MHEGSVARGVLVCTRGAFAQRPRCPDPLAALQGTTRRAGSCGTAPIHQRCAMALLRPCKKKKTHLVVNSRHSPTQMGLNYLKCFSRELALAV